MPFPLAPPVEDLTGLATATYIQLGDLGIAQSVRVDGVRWDIEPIGGWESGLPTTIAVQQRSADHGGYAQRPDYAPRVLEVKGTLYGGTWNEITAAVDQIRAAVPALDPADLLVEVIGERPLTASVQQLAMPLVDRAGRIAKFSLSLVAVDPRRYATTVVTFATGLPDSTGGLIIDDSTTIDDTFTVADDATSGVLSLTNEGNMDTPWVGTLTGPVPAGASITHRGSGKTLRIPHEVADGRVLTIDSDLRRALLDGTASRVVTGSWFSLDPGVNEVSFSAPTFDAGAQLSIAFRSAWK